MKALLDFSAKPSYAPVIDLVNCLSQKHDVFLIPNKTFPPIGLDAEVVCLQHKNIHAVTPDVVFSTYSTLLAIAHLKITVKLPLVNYMFTHMMLRDFFSSKVLALPDSYKFGKLLDLIAFSLPKSLSMPEKLIVPNRIIKNELVELGFPEDKIIVLPWGLSMARYEQSHSFPSVTSVRNHDENVIVYAGPLHPLRVSACLLHAFSIVVKQNPCARLLLLLRKDLWHRHTYKKVVDAMKKLKLEDKVSIVISSSHAAYLSYVEQASVVVLPYFSSGIVEVPPFTLLECMALSKPVITSPGAATFGIIENGKNGFLMPENIFLLADLINFLMANKKRAALMGDEAKATIERKYSLANFCSGLSDLLESCS